MVVVGYTADGDSKCYSQLTEPWANAILRHSLDANGRFSELKVVL